MTTNHWKTANSQIHLREGNFLNNGTYQALLIVTESSATFYQGHPSSDPTTNRAPSCPIANAAWGVSYLLSTVFKNSLTFKLLLCFSNYTQLPGTYHSVLFYFILFLNSTYPTRKSFPTKKATKHYRWEEMQNVTKEGNPIITLRAAWPRGEWSSLSAKSLLRIQKWKASTS